MSLLVDWCGFKAAKYAVEHWHYSRRMPAGKLAKIGVWEEGKFVGAVLFGWGAQIHLVRQYGLQFTEGCELVRVALRHHETKVTEIIGKATRMLKKKMPGLRLIVSFADANQNHLGIIYQAGNWIYTGQTPPDKFPVIRPRITHPRTLSDMILAGKVRKRSDVPHVDVLGKHRYLYPLDKGMRRQILPLAQPYPKRGQGVHGDTPTVQVGELGSSPRVRSDMTSGEPELVNNA